MTWSPALEALHGIAPGAFGGTFAAFRADIHPDDLARVEQIIARSLQAGTHRLEYRIIRPDGAVRWLRRAARCPMTRTAAPHACAASAWTSPRARTPTRSASGCSRRSARRGRGPRTWSGGSALVGEIARSITASLDLDTVLQRIADGAQALCRSDSAAIFLRAGDAMQPRYRVGPWPASYPSPHVRAGEGIEGLAMQTGRPARSDDYAADRRVSAAYHAMAQETGTVTLMVVPMIIRTEVAGLLYISNRTARVFTDEDEAVCTRLAEQAAIAIQNAELFARQQAARAEAEATNNAKDQFLAMLGHELRNPLGADQQCRARPGPRRRRRAPRRARAGHHQPPGAAARPRSWTTSSTSARVTSGKITLERQPLDLAELVRRAAALLAPSTTGRPQTRSGGVPRSGWRRTPPASSRSSSTSSRTR